MNTPSAKQTRYAEEASYLDKDTTYMWGREDEKGPTERGPSSVNITRRWEFVFVRKKLRYFVSRKKELSGREGGRRRFKAGFRQKLPRGGRFNFAPPVKLKYTLTRAPRKIS
jgi:hypothetical protein